MTYKLTLNEHQAEVLIAALDLYSRIGIGQFEECLQVFDRGLYYSIDQREVCRKYLDLAKFTLAGFSSGASHGIHNPNVNDDFRVAYDMKQVVRHRLSWDRNPKGGITVNFDEPSQISKEPLSEIEKQA